MPQLHFSVPESVADEVRRRAKCAGVSVSKYLADRVSEEHGKAAHLPEWFYTEIVGGWEGEPLVRPEQLPWEERDELL